MHGKVVSRAGTILEISRYPMHYDTRYQELNRFLPLILTFDSHPSISFQIITDNQPSKERAA